MNRSTTVKIAALVTLGSGLVNLYSVIGRSSPERRAILAAIFPLEFLNLSRFLILIAGFALVISSINIYKRKTRAIQFALLLAGLSVVFHLTKGLDYEEAVLSMVFLVVLCINRGQFTVRSSHPSFADAIITLGVATAVVLFYGIAGFWFLDRHDFGINFTLGDAVRSTFALLALSTKPHLVPHTHYASWFLDSFYVIAVAAISYSVLSVFRPAIYQYRTLPQERSRATDLVAKYGQTSLDYFKTRTDKSFYFSSEGDCFIAYRVGAACAIGLGDPIGPESKIGDTVSGFLEFCEENDWKPALYQTSPDYIGIYRQAGLHKLKIGDDAIVELDRFSLEGKATKKFRHTVQNLENSGARIVLYDPPIPERVLSEAKDVSDDWLRLPGRRERTFAVGAFDPEYLRNTPLATVVDSTRRMLAFVNIISSKYPRETTADLMRHRIDAPNGTMDYLFVKLLALSKERGFARLDLGMAPMAGFRENEQASAEEKAVHYFFQRLNFLFSFKGLLHYKAKFATSWEPRYLIFRHVLDLPRVAAGLSRVSELKAEKD